jgi:long-subunit acyl-CoA synthetase (AMP-forming)
MGIFSENRPEYALIEIACISDSITVVAIPVRSAEETSVSVITTQTELQTVCVSSNTLPLILDMLEQG